MIDWLTILIALVIIATLVGVFGYLAWQINMSDSLTTDDSKQVSESSSAKTKKEKNVSEQGKKKRKDQKKTKRDNKEDEQPQTKTKGTAANTSEETDDEREESEQELANVPSQTAETSSKARKRNKNKAQVETDMKNTTTTRAPPVTHPKSTSKDESETSKQQTKVQAKSGQVPNNKPTTTAPITTANKKPTQPVEDLSQEQPFTVVGGNRHKTTTQTSQQQQNKPPMTTTPAAVPASLAPAQQTPAAQPQHEQLVQRQQAPQKQTPVRANPSTNNPVPPKQQSAQPTPKVADLIKVLPSSQLVVTELMSALDAYPLSADELDIIMQKIANKQVVVKQDWNKLQLGQKVNPQAHIGQVMDESAKAYADDMKSNSSQRVKELTDALNAEKRRSQELLKEKMDKERENQILHAQLDSAQHKSTTNQATTSQPQQQKLQTLEMQLKRMTEENAHLSQQLAQHQQMTASNSNNTGDASNLRLQLLSDQVKKLSVDNANWEKKAHSNELLAKEAQKEKEDLTRYNEQLTQSLQNAEKELKSIEEKHHRQLNESRTSHQNELNESKRRIEQLESENEQLRREDIVHVEPSSPTHIQTMTVNNEEREQFEKEIAQLKQAVDANQNREREHEDLKRRLTAEVEEQKKRIDDLQNQRQTQENELRQEIERLKQDKANVQQQADESRHQELNALRAELDQVKSRSEEQVRHERENQRKVLTELLTDDLRSQLPHDNQDFDQWLTSYRQVVETDKRNSYEECAALKRDNEQLYKNMTDAKNQLTEIEQTVQSKEESLLSELKDKESTAAVIRAENDHLAGEVQRLRDEIQQLHAASANEVRALKHQLDEKFLAANSPTVIADESFELVKQPSPSLSPIVIDIRAEQLNELIRSSKEALENQDSITQQLDKHLNDIHPSAQGEASSSSTVSSDQQS